MRYSEEWIALAIGNSRLHWAWFEGTRVKLTWDTPHLREEAIALLLNHAFDFTHLQKWLPALHSRPPLWLASVVPAQTSLWHIYDQVHLITLEQIPLQGLYPTLGIDRALTLTAAIETWGAPILVIDAGTALTFTAARAGRQLAGGAILPGMQLQMRSLSQNTASLPDLSSFTPLPCRWAITTPEAIRSGVVYTTLAGIRDFSIAWLQDFPQSAIALTGGDSALLAPLLQPDLTIHHAPHLIFEGIQVVKARGI